MSSTRESQILDYHKILSTFYDKHTRELYNRQLALLKKVVRVNGAGYHIADLTLVSQVIAAAYSRVKNDQQNSFVEPVKDLIQLCSRPLHRRKANEELVMPEQVPMIITQLGITLGSGIPELQVVAAEALYQMSTGEGLSRGTNIQNYDLRVDPQCYSQKVLQECGIVETTVQVLHNLIDLESQNEDSANDLKRVEAMEVLLFPVMELIESLSQWPLNSMLLTKSGALDDIIKILATVHDLKDDLLPICINIMWNVLEHAGLQSEISTESSAILCLGSAQSVSTFIHILKLYFENGHRQTDKELRNNCIIVLSLIATDEENRENIRSSGMLDLLIHFSIAAELGNVSAKQYHNFSEICSQDFELKCLLWSLLAQASNGNQESIDSISSSPLFQVLLMYVMSDETESKIVHQWSESQLLTLKFSAFSVLQSIATAVPDKFNDLNGATVLLQCISSTLNADIGKCATLLLYSTCVGSEVKNELGKMGAIETLLEMFRKEGQDIEIQKNILSIISRLCRDREENQNRFRRANGILLLQENMHYDISEEPIKQNIVVSVVDCLWSCVISNKKSETRFLKLGGIDELMNLLEVCPALMKNQVLGVLSDLCANPKAAAEFQGWRSPFTTNTASQLLLSLWLEEEKRLQVQRPESGEIRNLQRPLDKHVISEIEAEQQFEHESPAFARLMHALNAAQGMGLPNDELQVQVNGTDQRAKIYALLSHVGFQLANDKLSVEHQITLAVAKEYPAFFKGQAWLDVKTELSKDNIRPIFADALLIESKLEHSFNVAINTKLSQMGIWASNEKVQINEEEHFFGDILKQKEHDLQVLLLQKKNRQPKGNMKSRLEAKARKEEMLKQSLQVHETNLLNAI